MIGPYDCLVAPSRILICVQTHSRTTNETSFAIFDIHHPVVFMKIMKELDTVITTSCVIHPNNINLIHRGRAAISVSVRCLALVKMHGNNRRKLFVKIMRNNDVRL